MLLYSLKCQKRPQKVKIRKLQWQKSGRIFFYQNKQCMIVNNQNLSDSKKRGLLMDYY